MSDPNELVPGILTTTFAGIVLALYVQRVSEKAYGPLDMADLAKFSGLTAHTLNKMRDMENGWNVDVTTPSGSRRYYSPTKVALARELIEALAIGADAKAEHDAMPRHCRP